ncbi:hypothetical protein BB558_007366 [Smittium angustum]|uniref:Uncharacterized protein n=1 Tax=Smittium angustum TaxID=133377 RepID=A0A2U1IV72_SMIAN|nr:hypothetical protein BB558_007366 [Smittium angustum]
MYPCIHPQQNYVDLFTKTAYINFWRFHLGSQQHRESSQDYGTGTGAFQKNGNTSCVLSRQCSNPRGIFGGVPELKTIVQKHLTNLGFTINHEKSVTIPKTQQIFLELLFDTQKITLNVTKDRKKKIKRETSYGVNGLFSAAAVAIRPSSIKSREIQLDITQARNNKGFNVVDQGNGKMELYTDNDKTNNSKESASATTNAFGTE